MSNPTFSNKNGKYVYTEADLGEGLLDAGVNYDYSITNIKIKKSNNLKYALTLKTLGARNRKNPTQKEIVGKSFYAR